MRNKGFFWTLTIVLFVVSLYQLSFSFKGNKIEKEAAILAEERADSLKAIAGSDSVPLPNDTYVNFETDNEAYDLAKSAFMNEILKEKNDEKVYLGNTFKEVKSKSVALGLDLEGGMSVTLELSMPDLVQNAALNRNDLHFAKPYSDAVKEFHEKGGDFIDIFTRKHAEQFPDRPLIREFSTDEVLSKISNKASDGDVKDYLNSLTDGALDGVETIMENRINQFGVAQPNITKDKGANRLYIELPGVKDQATVRSRLQSTANLEFYLAFKGQELGNFFNELLVAGDEDDNLFDDDEDDLFDDEEEIVDSLAIEDDLAVDSLEAELDFDLDEELADEDDFDFDNEEDEVKLSRFGELFSMNIDVNNQFLNSPRLGFAKAKDTSEINSLLNDKAEEMMLDNVRFVWGANDEKLGSGKDDRFYTLFALKIPDDLKARVGGTDITNARVSFDQNTAERGVSVSMNNHGAEEWGKMTTENVGNFIAITMDNKVFSAPIINTPITGGQTLISGNFTVDEAQGLSDLLNAGALPAPMNIVDEAVIGPTIGADNARSGLLSFVFALLLVLCYMVFYYGKAGLVADIALVTNIGLLIGFLAAFGAVLTLAGIAGIVLTMGMSVDANVLIFERAREEIREGKGMKLVIKDGYKNALSSILDANITTLLTAIMLAIFGQGPIESFAITLIIGIFTSVFTAVVVTRLIFEYQLSKKKEFKFSTPITKNAFTNMNIPFIKNRRKFYLVSGVLILIGIVALMTRGLKPSVEFTGGRTYELVFEKPVAEDIESINDLLRASLVTDGTPASVSVKTRNSDYRIEIATDYLQGVPNAETKAEEDILKAFQSEGADYKSVKVENSRSISPSVSEELKTSSMIAITLSLIAIFVYIFIRFGRWQLGLGATIALAHDVMIVLGIFALFHGVMPFNMEVDQAFIAAILTVIGYSINDTVVVFDRVREFVGKYRRRDFETNANNAINSTLGRTINTSTTTFIVLLTIFIFDGGSIKGFVFALMIGVILGTYSSICVATPLAIEFMNKEERKGSLDTTKK